MSDGSRWYYPRFEGLVDAKHVGQMGMAVWLYDYMVSRAFVAQNGGVLRYSHIDAARVLGRSERTIRLWFSTLLEYGYLTTRARHPYDLEVEVTKWRSVEDWLDARRSGRDGQNVAGLSRDGPETGNENGNENGKILPPSPIYITLSHYEYPSGSGERGPGNMAAAFRELLEHLKGAPNKAAVLAEIYRLCFGDTEVPEYGYLGKAAKAVGGAGRLAELMWQATAKPPTGDVLAYLMAIAKRKGGPPDDGVPRGKAATAAWLAAKKRSKEAAGGG